MTYTEEIKKELEKKYQNQSEFLQAVNEFLYSVEELVNADPAYQKAKILERLTEPDRVISFRVDWEDDKGDIQVNKAFRVQFNNAVGPYKGGLRFHPSVNESILKFLGFEQIFKNALTGLWMGGAKGGSDFDPKGKTDNEVRRFVKSFMGELSRYVGLEKDVPAGDIGVGGREIAFIAGEMKRITGNFTTSFTGKPIDWGGSKIREEATGYGLIYFLEEMLGVLKTDLVDKMVLISGSGNVAQFTLEKLLEKGAKVLSLSDSDGTIISEKGLTSEHLAFLKHLKNTKRGRISEMADEFNFKYLPGKKPWGQAKADIALPCATQNEINLEDAKLLFETKVKVVAEGSNMSTEIPAIDFFRENQITYAPGKATNAGGVAVSNLEMMQNASLQSWSRTKVDKKLKNIMRNLHLSLVDEIRLSKTKISYVESANIVGLKRVAKAMLQQGF